MLPPRQKRPSETAHLADMISEDRLVLCASDLPLEPRLRLPVVGNLQRSCTIANLWQVRHGVPDSDGSVDSSIASVEGKRKNEFCVQSHWGFVIQNDGSITSIIRNVYIPCDITDVFLFVHHHAQRAGSGGKHMQRLRITRQLLAWSSSQDDRPAAGLGNTILTSLWRTGFSMLVV